MTRSELITALESLTEPSLADQQAWDARSRYPVPGFFPPELERDAAAMDNPQPSRWHPIARYRWKRSAARIYAWSNP